MSPRAVKAPPAPKAWRRDEGRYRSADDRFTIEGGGAGRWFVTDAGSLDELGLARTLGPYATLDAAKAAAAEQRDAGVEASPLAGRLAAADDGRSRPRASAPKAGRAPKGTASPEDGTGRARERGQDDHPAPEPPRARKPAPPPRSWLEELRDEDPDAAARARRLIDALTTLGLEDADALVRRDVLGRQPAIASRLLSRTLAAALRGALEPTALAKDARTAITGPMRRLSDADEEALAAYGAFVAARVLAATLHVVATRERADGAGSDVPGWRLVERPGSRDGEEEPARRLIVTAADLPAVEGAD